MQSFARGENHTGRGRRKVGEAQARQMSFVGKAGGGGMHLLVVTRRGERPVLVPRRENR